ncbi:hypothetical protein SPRG_16146, partial [Saprolegnia parasitica CBS 223.65]
IEFQTSQAQEVVWTRANIEKVRRDERVHEEAEHAALREKYKRSPDVRVEALKKTKPTPPAIDLFASDMITPPPVASIENLLRKLALQQSQDDNDATKAPRAANADTMAAIVSRPKALLVAANNTREADALNFAGNTTSTELKKTAKSSSSSSSRLEQA